ncbi:hypothetical protein Tco_1180400 [Tanacetum coccineum]
MDHHFARGPYAYIMATIGPPLPELHTCPELDYPTDRVDDDDVEDEDEVLSKREGIGGGDPGSGRLCPPGRVRRLLPKLTPPPSPLLHYLSPLPHYHSPHFQHHQKPASPIRSVGAIEAAMFRHEVGESSAAGAARQDGPAVVREDPYSVARGDLYGFVYRVDVTPGRPMSSELDYGITDTWDDLETTIMYGMMEDAQDDRSLLRARVKLLYMDRPIHRRLTVMTEREARMALGQHALISELQSANHMRQEVIKELLAADHQRQKMAPKRRTTRLNPGATPTPVTDTHTTTFVTNAQLQAMIDEGVTAVLAARNVTRNGDDSHTSGTGARRPV